LRLPGRPAAGPDPAGGAGSIRRIASTAIEVFFTERFVHLAKPGGLIALIVPESILASDQLGAVAQVADAEIQAPGSSGIAAKVFTGVGAKAKTGDRLRSEVRCRAGGANAKADAPLGVARLAPELREKKVIMVSPNTEGPDWKLTEYLAAALEGRGAACRKTRPGKAQPLEDRLPRTTH